MPISNEVSDLREAFGFLPSYQSSWRSANSALSRLKSKIFSTLSPKEAAASEPIELKLNPSAPHLLLNSGGSVQWQNELNLPEGASITEQLKWVEQYVPTPRARWLTGLDLLMAYFASHPEHLGVCYTLEYGEYVLMEHFELGFGMRAYYLEPILSGDGSPLLVFPDSSLEIASSHELTGESPIEHFFELYEKIHADIQEWLNPMLEEGYKLLLAGRGLGGGLAAYAMLKHRAHISMDPEPLHALFDPIGLPKRLAKGVSSCEAPLWTLVTQGCLVSRIAALVGEVFEVQGRRGILQQNVILLSVDTLHELELPSRKEFASTFQSLVQARHGLSFDYQVVCAPGREATVDLEDVEQLTASLIS